LCDIVLKRSHDRYKVKINRKIVDAPAIGITYFSGRFKLFKIFITNSIEQLYIKMSVYKSDKSRVYFHSFVIPEIRNRGSKLKIKIPPVKINLQAGFLFAVFHHL